MSQAEVVKRLAVLDALLGVIQEGTAEKALDSIRNMLSADSLQVTDADVS